MACVPLGVSRFSHEAAMRPHTRGRGRGRRATLVERVAGDLPRVPSGRRMVYAADEYYLMAERPFPAAATYEGFPQHENGLGMARAFEAAFGGDERAALGVRPGLLRRGRRGPGRRLPGTARAGRRRRVGGAGRARPWPSSPASTAPGCSAPWSTRSGRDDIRLVAGAPTTSSAATSGWPAC